MKRGTFEGTNCDMHRHYILNVTHKGPACSMQPVHHDYCDYLLYDITNICNSRIA